MPKQSRGFWICEYCQATFDGFDEAQLHEANECPQNTSAYDAGVPYQPQFATAAYPTEGMAPFSPPHGVPHYGYEQEARPRRFPLLDPLDTRLAEVDVIACQNLEIFEHELQQFHPEHGGVLNQCGIRCGPCAHIGEGSEGTEFSLPRSVSSVGDAVRRLADHHLSKCSHVPLTERQALEQGAKRRKSMREEGGPAWQEDERYQRVLTEYCTTRCQQLGIINKFPVNTGIMFQYADPPFQSGMAPVWHARPTPLHRTPMDSSKPGTPMTGTPREHFPRPSTQYRRPSSHIGARAMGPPQDFGAHYQQFPPMGPPDQGYPRIQGYTLPSNFPFFQDPVHGDWICKYCSHLHPQYREANYRWSSSTMTPPPGEFIDYHLSMCRNYVQGMQGSVPEAYHGPHLQPQNLSFSPTQPHWDPSTATSMHPSMAAVHHGEIPSAYGAPMQSSLPRQGRIGELHGLSEVRRQSRVEAAAQRAIDFLTANDQSILLPDGRILDESKRLVREEDKLLLTDFLYYLMKQLRVVRFSEADRKTRGGKREKIQVGYGGLQCVHCSHIEKSRKFFWSGVDRLANSFAEIPAHVFKCKYCPDEIKNALTNVKKFHAEQMARLPRGSQKVFFRRVWKRLHEGDPAPEEEAADSSPDFSESLDSPPDEKGPSPGGTPASEESILFLERPTKDAARTLAEAARHLGPPSPSSRVLLAIAEDRDFLSDTDCFIRKQLEVFCATAEDVRIAQDDRKYPVNEGQCGIRCIHCALSKNGRGASGHAVAYPFSISGIFESVREFQRLHLEYCDNIPQSLRSKLLGMKESTTITSIQRKYYVLAAKGLGLHDTKDGIRSGAESVPVIAQAVFAFSEESPTGSDEQSASRNPHPSTFATMDQRKRPAVRDEFLDVHDEIESPLPKKPTPDSRNR